LSPLPVIKHLDIFKNSLLSLLGFLITFTTLQTFRFQKLNIQIEEGQMARPSFAIWNILIELTKVKRNVGFSVYVSSG